MRLHVIAKFPLFCLVSFVMFSFKLFSLSDSIITPPTVISISKSSSVNFSLISVLSPKSKLDLCRASS